jgi:positive regulator of sigma E activity
MNDSKEEQPDVNTSRTKSIETVQATKSGNHGKPPYPTISITRRKRLRFIGLIALVSLGAIVVIVFVSRSGLAHSYEGLAAALCVIACGVLLVRRFIRVLAEEDELQAKQLKVNQATVSPSHPNPAGPQANLTAPSPEAGENIKYRKS